jgi:integrase
MKPIVTFAVATGMRLGEICDLRISSFEVDESGAAYVMTGRTKNGERLAWPLEGWAREFVEARVGDEPFGGAYLFPGPNGGNAYTSIKRNFRATVERSGLVYGREQPNGVTFHTFRHSMASLALNHGVPESVVQRMGNWKTRRMLDRYAHLADETLRQGAATVVNLIDHRPPAAPGHRRRKS